MFNILRKNKKVFMGFEKTGYLCFINVISMVFLERDCERISRITYAIANTH